MTRTDHYHEYVRIDDNLRVCGCGSQRRPRIRVTAESARLLEETLEDLLTDLWEERAEGQGNGQGTAEANRQIRLVRGMLGDIAEAREYFEWSDVTTTSSGLPVSSSA